VTLTWIRRPVTVAAMNPTTAAESLVAENKAQKTRSCTKLIYPAVLEASESHQNDASEILSSRPFLLDSSRESSSGDDSKASCHDSSAGIGGRMTAKKLR
jgi:hypothetical protein